MLLYTLAAKRTTAKCQNSLMLQDFSVFAKNQGDAGLRQRFTLWSKYCLRHLLLSESKCINSEENIFNLLVSILLWKIYLQVNFSLQWDSPGLFWGRFKSFCILFLGLHQLLSCRQNLQLCYRQVCYIIGGEESRCLRGGRCMGGVWNQPTSAFTSFTSFFAKEIQIPTITKIGKPH